MAKVNYYKIYGCVQHYDWGGFTFLPQLLNDENQGKIPFAELWFGTHSGCPARLSQGMLLLDQFKTDDIRPDENSIDPFQLPFLCKILDVKDMLSIQLHPSKPAAEKGYAEERDLNIPLNAFNRSFKDQNHKPELMYALSTFYLLHGFRETDDLLSSLHQHPALKWAAKEIEVKGLALFYANFMQLDQGEVNTKLLPLKTYLQSLGGLQDKNHPDFWAQRALSTFDMTEDIDRGLLSIYLFKLLYLRPGEVIFQGAGIPHAYLEGQNVEVMANSDNVIRGGLTKKYINHQVLLDMIDFDNREIGMLTPLVNENTNELYQPPVEDFQLEVFNNLSEESLHLNTSTVSMVFSANSSFDIVSNGEMETIETGAAVVLLPNAQVQLKSAQRTRVFCISVKI